MATIAGVKLGNMAKSKISLGKNVGKISPDPYSYEHRIQLDQDAMDKMGVVGTPKVGDVFHVVGEGHIHSVSTDHDLNGKPTVRVGMQMRKMGAKPKSEAKGGGALNAVSEGVKQASE